MLRVVKDKDAQTHGTLASVSAVLETMAPYGYTDPPGIGDALWPDLPERFGPLVSFLALCTLRRAKVCTKSRKLKSKKTHGCNREAAVQSQKKRTKGVKEKMVEGGKRRFQVRRLLAATARRRWPVVVVGSRAVHRLLDVIFEGKNGCHVGGQ